MRHKHGTRGGQGNTATSVRDAYGFEVLVVNITLTFGHRQRSSFLHYALTKSSLQVKKEMLSLYQKYAPLWEKEEVERSERWDAYLAHFETMYQPDTPSQ